MNRESQPESGYDRAFYQYIGAGSLRSAERVIGAIADLLVDIPEAVLDVGCGTGAWLQPWKHRGASVTGVEGSAAAIGLLEDGELIRHDLRTPLDIGKRFGLVQCLEVAEHLPAEYATVLVATLCRHSDIVLFSAAPPGQGGEHHVNEQPYEYWRRLFADCGYSMYDPLRRALIDDAGVKPWYRFNTFVYLRDGAAPACAARLTPFRVPVGGRVADLSPLIYRLRKRAIAALPVSASTAMARIKKRLFNRLGMS